MLIEKNTKSPKPFYLIINLVMTLKVINVKVYIPTFNYICLSLF
jgi:hypothetical protein